jgi:hypothetical protein
MRHAPPVPEFSPPLIPAAQFRELQRAIAHAAVDRFISQKAVGDDMKKQSKGGAKPSGLASIAKAVNAASREPKPVGKRQDQGVRKALYINK